MIDGNTTLLAHIGFPTHTFTAPLIYNPYFEQAGINAVVVPMGCREANFPAFLKAVFSLENVGGALVTMPHKVTTVGLVDEVSAAASIAGACNAVRRTADGRLQGDLFDGEGFVRGLARKGCTIAGASALVVGSGGVGSAIAASLAGVGVARLSLFDAMPGSANALAARLKKHHASLEVAAGTNDPAGYDIVVNATPLGMKDGDPLPFDIARVAPAAFVGEVVLKPAMTPLLLAAQARGCRFQVGTDMLFEQIPAYLEYFGLPSTTPDALRAVARLAR
ncbi:MAG: shikimate dehydrogenase [Lautropia sp.]